MAKNLLIKTLILLFFPLAAVSLFYYYDRQAAEPANFSVESQVQEQEENLTGKPDGNQAQSQSFPAKKEQNSSNPEEQNNGNSKEDKDDVLKKKIGQMLIVGFRGSKIAEKSTIGGQIESLNLGGVILFDYDNPSKSFPMNIINPEQTKTLISGLQSFSDVPLFVSIDAEGGLINRLKEKYGFTDFPSAQYLGEKNDPALTEQTANDLGRELKNLGFNLNFAPDADVNINPDNPVIGKLERSFSNDPEKTAKQAIAFIKGLHKNDIISAIKHFPGHGSSKNDSHLGLTDVTKTYRQEELIPFQRIIEQGYADMVMTAHIMNKTVDENYPATLSPLFLQDILRKQLGFQGVIISDDMQMGAIAKNYGFQESVIKSINAGCDVLILSNNNDNYDKDIAPKARDIIFEAVKNGEIKEETINNSYLRIMNLKKKFGLIE
ncbi:MAG: glycoside hydrolase family 3 protein [Candidatus Paceibacterota bacterium]